MPIDNAKAKYSSWGAHRGRSLLSTIALFDLSFRLTFSHQHVCTVLKM